MRSLLLGVLLAVGLLGPAHAAITFNFSWVNGSYSATGVMTVNRTAGQNFQTSDITFSRTEVSDGGSRSFVFGTWDSFTGNITANGLSAFVTNASFTSLVLGYFGCKESGCTDGVVRVSFGANSSDFAYKDRPAALSSMQLTAVPLPAALPMAAVAFGGLAALSRRRRGTATAQA